MLMMCGPDGAEEYDGFLTRSEWVDMYPDADRIALDTHPYIAFGTALTLLPSSHK